jgi:hypothetical protein
VSEFAEWYAKFMKREREFFLALFPDESIQRFDHFLSMNEYSWLHLLIPKYEPKSTNITDYTEFTQNFTLEMKVLQLQTLEQFRSLLQQNLDTLLQRDVSEILSGYNDKSLGELIKLLKSVEPYSNPQSYLEHILEIFAKIQ